MATVAMAEGPTPTFAPQTVPAGPAVAAIALALGVAAAAMPGMFARRQTATATPVTVLRAPVAPPPVVAAETCNGLDDDCDGFVDDGCTWRDPQRRQGDRYQLLGAG